MKEIDLGCGRGSGMCNKLSDDDKGTIDDGVGQTVDVVDGTTV